MTQTPPTWRDLAARAATIGVAIAHGPHEASVLGPGRGGAEQATLASFTSWVERSADSIILRTAVAAALEQLEKR